MSIENPTLCDFVEVQPAEAHARHAPTVINTAFATISSSTFTFNVSLQVLIITGGKKGEKNGFYVGQRYFYSSFPSLKDDTA